MRLTFWFSSKFSVGCIMFKHLCNDKKLKQKVLTDHLMNVLSPDINKILNKLLLKQCPVFIVPIFGFLTIFGHLCSLPGWDWLLRSSWTPWTSWYSCEFSHITHPYHDNSNNKHFTFAILCLRMLSNVFIMFLFIGRAWWVWPCWTFRFCWTPCKSTWTL